MKDMPLLLDGYRTFRAETFPANRALYRDLVAHGQSPRAMVIACCDSRVEPSTIFNTRPGELFMVRNVANLVPPYEPQGEFHGTSAAIEFAVTGLEVAHIVVLGHAFCGGVKAFLEGLYGPDPNRPFITRWMSLLTPALRDLQDSGALSDAEAARRTLELASIKQSLSSLETFPFVKAAMAEGRLALHGLFFDIERGLLLEYDPAVDAFGPVDGDGDTGGVSPPGGA